MKKRVLLVDESLTVQKVVALTLDKSKYVLSFAKSRAEVMKLVVENPPDLMLVSDQVPDVNVGSFPKELEAWLGGVRDVPPVILITGQDIKEHRHYAAVLRKPFAPQALQRLVNEHAQSRAPEIERDSGVSSDEFEDQRLQKIFNDTFADESTLMRETFKNEMHNEESRMNPQPPRTGSGKSNDNLWEEKKTNPNSAPPLWDNNPTAPVVEKSDDLWGMGQTASPTPSNPPGRYSLPAAEGHFLSENQVEQKLKEQNLSEMVDRVLSRIVPPIVERLVQERLDKLMKDQEQFFELKP